MNKSLLTILFVCVFAAAIPYIVRSFLWNKFTKTVNKKEYDKALELLDNRAYRFLFGELNIDFNILKVYLTMKDNDRIVAQTNHILSLKMNKEQRAAICSSTFFYFIDAQNQEMAKRILEQIRLCANDTEYNYDAAMYRVIIEKKSEDIDYLQTLLKENAKALQNPANAQQLGMINYMLGLQYSYNNDRKQAQLHFNRAKTNLKGTPYHKKIKKLMGE